MDSSWKFNPRRLCAAAMLLSVSLAWSFTAPTELEAGIAGRERTLVACKSLFSGHSPSQYFTMVADYGLVVLVR